VRVCIPAAGKSTFVRLLQAASEDWEVIPEPIGKWCNVQNDNDDIYQVNMQHLNAAHLTGELFDDDDEAKSIFIDHFKHLNFICH